MSGSDIAANFSQCLLTTESTEGTEKPKLGARGWGLGQFQTLNAELLSSFSPQPAALRLRTAALALYLGSPAICCFKASAMEASEPNSF